MRGRVISGKGEGAKFMNLSWVRRQTEEKLGFTPYPGTLNIELTGRSVRAKQSLTKVIGMKIRPSSGYCGGKVFVANLMNVACAVVVPDVVDYPEDVVEVVSSENLRERFHLVDGDPIDVEVKF